MSQQIKINKVQKKENYAKYEILPFPRGYGHTFATPLRRVLLSSIQGVAITKVKIKGAEQEFKTIPGVKEDVLNLILNLQKVVFDLNGSEEEKVTLNVSGEKEVKASDIKCPGNVTIKNPDLVIANLTDSKAELEIEMQINSGYGFKLREDELRNQEPGVIPLNQDYSPVDKVNVEVEATRVDQDTNYEKIVLDIYTNGGVTTDEALKQCVQTLLDKFTEFNQVVQAYEDIEVEEEGEDGEEEDDVDAAKEGSENKK